jgi:hypothetical protein
MWHVMEKRDNQLIEDEILHGAGSSAFVYSFKIKGKEISGVSVVGARYLATKYGGLKHRILSSTQKDGARFTYRTYPDRETRQDVSSNMIPDLADEPDYYSVMVEVEDIKTGNTIQVEAEEKRYEPRDDGSYWEKPHYRKIAQAKAYRNAILDLVPQTVVLAWKIEMLKLQKGEIITDSVIEQKRKSVLTYTASQGIPLLRSAVNDLSMEQIDGLAEAARSKDKARFAAALEGLNLKEGEGDEEKRTQKTNQAPKDSPRKAGRDPEAHGEEDTGAKASGKQEGAGRKRASLFRDDD